MSKILLLDIETAPAKAFVWKLFDDFVPLERLIEPSHMICWSAKWHGKKGNFFGAEWCSKTWIEELRNLLIEADAVVTYNGDKFDLPKINGEFVKAGLPPLPQLTSIDLYKVVRKLGFTSNKLAHVAPLLGLGDKTDTGGFSLWRRVGEGDERAYRLMERYNRQDVLLLGRLYTRLRPHIKNHPYIGNEAGAACPNCGGKRLQRRGPRRTKSFLIQRMHCTSCGAWSDGPRQKVKTVE